MTYNNILNALSQQNAAQNQYQTQMDSLQTRTENYRMADELSKQGTSIKDVLGQIDELKKKVEALESPKSEVGREVFAVMEKAVEHVPAVKDAKKRMADMKSAIITEMCLKDARFKDLYEDYKAVVNREYVASHESAKSSDTK